MRKYNINANLVRATKHLCGIARSAAQVHDSTNEWLRSTVGVRQECVLSLTFFSICLKRILEDALEEHGEEGCIGWRTIKNQRVDGDIGALVKEEHEQEAPK